MKTLGVMLDCSRNGVLSVDGVKGFADIIKKASYNMLMLYTEDTYEVDGEPLFGHFRGRYSKDEMKELDSYCKSIGIELIPCIQTLAHLEHMFKWHDYMDVCECDNILYTGSEKTYKLIENMFSTLRECYSTDRIHIGMDEAYRVGLGKHLSKHGLKDRFDIINEHLHRVCEIASKYNFKPMIWSDMFCKLALNSSNYYEDGDNSKILEKANLPDSVSLVYWDYYSTEYDVYDRMIKTNKAFGKDVIFGGGAWAWSGFAPLNKDSIDKTLLALSACKNNDIDQVFFTVWGDNGAECLPHAILPTLIYASEYINGNTDEKKIKEKFESIVGTSYDGFMLFDKLNTPSASAPSNTKAILYNDIFLGLCDRFIEEGFDEYFKKLAWEIKSVAFKGEYSCLYDMYALLCEILSDKCYIALNLRKAYNAKDVKKIEEIISICASLTNKLSSFEEVYGDCWSRFRKPFGFEVQEIRFGGLRNRINSVSKKLSRYINGDISIIEELEEENTPGNTNTHMWETIVTPNAIVG